MRGIIFIFISIVYVSDGFRAGMLPLGLRRGSSDGSLAPRVDGGALTINKPKRREARKQMSSYESQGPRSDFARTPSAIGTALNFLTTVWDFSRPHTLIGSAISLVCLYLYAVPPSLWMSFPFLKSLLECAIPSLLMNLYITGLNQLTDIEIDKINKPYLPLASGVLSYSHALLIVLGSLFAALQLTSLVSYPLKMTVVGSAIFGTMYSLPPFRLKRFPLLAAICIVAVRGSLVNLGFFLQAKTAVMGIPVGNSLKELMMTATSQFPESVAATAFFAVFGTIIAIMKDIPDIVGDRLFSIPSFSVKLGAKRVFDFAWQLLFSLLSLSAFACSASVIPTLLHAGANKAVLGNSLSRVASSVVLFALSKDVKKRASVVKPEDSDSVFKYYMQMWNIFYACYIILPFLR